MPVAIIRQAYILKRKCDTLIIFCCLSFIQSDTFAALSPPGTMLPPFTLDGIPARQLERSARIMP
jgi:hypothetical protein